MAIRPPAEEGEPFRFGVPFDHLLEFFGNHEVEWLYRGAIRRCGAVGGTPIAIDFGPFRDAARLLYEGPWVAERMAALRQFPAVSLQSLLPVTRQIFSGADKYTAVDSFEAQHRLMSLRRAAEAELAKVDALLLPTAGTTYTLAEVEADPFGPNRNLGYYTNFVNLLDLCALAVPAGFQANGLPASVSFIAPAGADRYLASL